MGDLDLPLLPENSLLKIDREVISQVITLLWPPSSGSAATGTRTTESLEERFEEISESTHVPHIGSPGGTA
tara:strand:+ start:338 stop:550 length:213 start_codon:yes stop_codon:yes gene_type:complete